MQYYISYILIYVFSFIQFNFAALFIGEGGPTAKSIVNQ